MPPKKNPVKGVIDASVKKAQDVGAGLNLSAQAMGVLRPEIQAKIIRPDQHSKAGKIVVRMCDAGYTKEQVNDVVGALVATRDDQMKSAFDLFAGADGVIDTEEMKTVVPLIGEDLDEEAVRCLFRQADKDSSGTIEFMEFTQMMYALTPKAKSGGRCEKICHHERRQSPCCSDMSFRSVTDLSVAGGLLEQTVELTQAQEALEKALLAVDSDPRDKTAINNLGAMYANLIVAENGMEELCANQNPEPVTPKSLLGRTADGFIKAGQSLEAGTTLRPVVQARILRPRDHQRAGRIIQRMNAYASGKLDRNKFSREDINNVLLSLLAVEDKEVIAAFKLWAGEDGVIDANEFREVVPLLGEDLTAEEIDCMFRAADKNSDGIIDLVEFAAMMKQMQMKGDGMERYRLVGQARAEAYAASVTS